MNAVLLGTYDPNSPEWHQARHDGIGASEISAVLGLSPWESRFSLWHRKADHLSQQNLSDVMEWGLRLEDAVAQKFADEHPELTVERTGTWCHSDRPWQTANPDRLIDGAIPVEIKVAHEPWEWGEPGTDEIPIYYRCQTLWQCDVLGADRAHLAVLIGGSDYREYVIEFDESDAATMRLAASEFLASVSAGEMPDIDAHSATYTAIKELHPEIDGSDHLVDTPLADRYVTARRQLKVAEEAEQLAKSQLAFAMGMAKRARWDGHTIADRRARNGGTPYLQAASKLPDITHADNAETEHAA